MADFYSMMQLIKDNNRILGDSMSNARNSMFGTLTNTTSNTPQDVPLSYYQNKVDKAKLDYQNLVQQQANVPTFDWRKEYDTATPANKNIIRTRVNEFFAKKGF